jgi:osmotically-inducible protein OsmY
MDSDTQVFQAVLEEFRHSPVARSGELLVDVQDGIVTISGRVNTLAERKAIERAAKRVAGVRTLILQIRAVLSPRTA